MCVSATFLRRPRTSWWAPPSHFDRRRGAARSARCAGGLAERHCSLGTPRADCAAYPAPPQATASRARRITLVMSGGRRRNARPTRRSRSPRSAPRVPRDWRRMASARRRQSDRYPRSMTVSIASAGQLSTGEAGSKSTLRKAHRHRVILSARSASRAFTAAQSCQRGSSAL